MSVFPSGVALSENVTGSGGGTARRLERRHIEEGMRDEQVHAIGPSQ